MPKDDEIETLARELHPWCFSAEAEHTYRGDDHMVLVALQIVAREQAKKQLTPSIALN